MALKQIYVGILLVFCINTEHFVSAISLANRSETVRSSSDLKQDTTSTPPTYIATGRLSCLSGDGLVRMESGLLKPVAELKSGDVVMAVNMATNEVVKSEIFMVAHSSSNTPTLFTAIETWTGQKVLLTPKHLIARGVQASATPDFIYAENVQENDYIYVRDEHDQLLPVKVKNVSEEMKMGYYSPFTLEGTIIVNDVVTSVYALFNNHHLAHYGIAPLRWYYKVVKSLNLANEPFASPEPNGELHWTNQFLYSVTKTLAPGFFS